MNLLSACRPTLRYRRLALFLLGGLAAAILLPAVEAYELQGERWPSNQTVVLDLSMNGPSSPLLDGSTSWNQVAEAAIAVWNTYLGSGVQLGYTEYRFKPADHDGKNSVLFDRTVFGEDFGDDTLGVTTYYYSTRTNLKTEADVVFNSAKLFNSYRGTLRRSSAGGTLNDLRRVAIHEFGHVLGLDHTPQGSASIMAPYITNLDTVQADDIAGLQAIYGLPPLRPPVINSASTATGITGVNFSYRITATNFPTVFAADGLPDGLALDGGSGYITGTLLSDGTYPITLSASNASGTGTATLILTVSSLPAINSPLAASGVVGQPFSYQIKASGQVNTYGAINLPSGLSIDRSTGLITGSPNVSGSFTVTLSALGTAGTAGASLRLNVQPDAGIIVLHELTDADGRIPNGGLVQAADGNLYGTTQQGGSHNAGTFFKLTPDDTLTVLHNFGEPGDPTSGVTSLNQGGVSALAQGGDGNFYAVATSSSPGGVIRLAPDGTMTFAHSFYFAEAGNGPLVPLTPGRDGALYGATRNEGQRFGLDSGTVFKMALDGTVTFLHVFDNHERGGFSPLQAVDGSLYGATATGGTFNRGYVYRLAEDGTLTILHHFTEAEGSPSGTPVQAADSLLYGTTNNGGTDFRSSIYKLAADGTLTVLRFLSDAEGKMASNLLPGLDGEFYGTTSFSTAIISGESQGGTLFKIMPDGTFTTIHRFGYSSSGPPIPGLTLGTDGEVYGVTSAGGDGNNGVLFRTNFHPAPIVTSALPVVTVEATTPQVMVGSGGKAVLTLRLSEPQATDLVIHYTVKGSAGNGTDYVQLSGTKKIKAGRTSKAIKIVPLGTLNGARKKVVKLTLSEDSTYTVGTTDALKVKLLAAP